MDIPFPVNVKGKRFRVVYESDEEMSDTSPSAAANVLPLKKKWLSYRDKQEDTLDEQCPEAQSTSTASASSASPRLGQPVVHLGHPIVQSLQPAPKMPKKRQRKSKLIPIGGRKYITIRKLGGMPQVNIRDYTEDSCGKLYSTKRGIMLTPQEWKQLKESLNSVDTFLEERELGAEYYVKKLVAPM